MGVSLTKELDKCCKISTTLADEPKLLSTESELLSTETLLLINKSTTQEELISTTPITTPSPTTTASTTSTISAATTAEAAAKKPKRQRRHAPPPRQPPPPPLPPRNHAQYQKASRHRPRQQWPPRKPQDCQRKGKNPTCIYNFYKRDRKTCIKMMISGLFSFQESQTSSVNRSKEYTTPPCASSLILNGFYICNRANRPRCCNVKDLMNDIKKQLEVFKKQIVSKKLQNHDQPSQTKTSRISWKETTLANTLYLSLNEKQPIQEHRVILNFEETVQQPLLQEQQTKQETENFQKTT
ncbi:conserved hypothetical protein [Trichinella spiralis]|uniref:hypothetical protein n=1 Tax=Trichinella spiralis TaxID=6334 RepID=UPI0001EFB456|nr:conserved hypothetical protein [Trichinella spiralis]